ncbi:hypothetical protein D187_007379 [Cystobacter fuscus DSM 2262]|uniref:Uncharacterized protein n=1 Tax=Cystobacter fuscus (strain ATCC 25194 / DSM 2262 / NBRC 100088 / M29) TaxID=1242864 RepID=S9P188_CYSF2|nr:hypothetical protein D187_007379 [Cystobacter fuscus DSM 2262]
MDGREARVGREIPRQGLMRALVEAGRRTARNPPEAESKDSVILRFFRRIPP